ncbi:hypothetical protein GHT07_01950 [Caenimonas koreensis DSM 17982]|uniref:Uncharacterized protein n=1 Tax=Caenimonas koreensis DSM 17982 TaxID=1121255 RepID=A0A844B445_9BURK|nr:hypothetical protein [Caenimonas koreensis]MRD46026.1 hypothetical protein [Caenimonas koreensis DSM 17982]
MAVHQMSQSAAQPASEHVTMHLSIGQPNGITTGPVAPLSESTQSHGRELLQTEEVLKHILPNNWQYSYELPDGSSKNAYVNSGSECEGGEGDLLESVPYTVTVNEPSAVAANCSTNGNDFELVPAALTILPGMNSITAMVKLSNGADASTQCTSAGIMGNGVYIALPADRTLPYLNKSSKRVCEVSETTNFIGGTVTGAAGVLLLAALGRVASSCWKRAQRGEDVQRLAGAEADVELARVPNAGANQDGREVPVPPVQAAAEGRNVRLTPESA